MGKLDRFLGNSAASMAAQAQLDALLDEEILLGPDTEREPVTMEKLSEEDLEGDGFGSASMEGAAIPPFYGAEYLAYAQVEEEERKGILGSYLEKLGFSRLWKKFGLSKIWEKVRSFRLSKLWEKLGTGRLKALKEKIEKLAIFQIVPKIRKFFENLKKTRIMRDMRKFSISYIRQRKKEFEEADGGFLEFVLGVLEKGLRVKLAIWNDGKRVFGIPMLVMVFGLLAAFWLTIPILGVGIIFGYRYKIEGMENVKKRASDAMSKLVSRVRMKRKPRRK